MIEMKKEIIISIECTMDAEKFAAAMAAQLRSNWRDEMREMLIQALAQANQCGEAQNAHVPTPEEREHWEEMVRNNHNCYVPSWFTSSSDEASAPRQPADSPSGQCCF